MGAAAGDRRRESGSRQDLHVTGLRVRYTVTSVIFRWVHSQQHILGINHVSHR